MGSLASRTAGRRTTGNFSRAGVASFMDHFPAPWKADWSRRLGDTKPGLSMQLQAAWHLGRHSLARGLGPGWPRWDSCHSACTSALDFQVTVHHALQVHSDSFLLQFQLPASLLALHPHLHSQPCNRLTLAKASAPNPSSP